MDDVNYPVSDKFKSEETEVEFSTFLLCGLQALHVKLWNDDEVCYCICGNCLLSKTQKKCAVDRLS